ncbi:uncharacterized protein LOC111046938 [Nilaparvata lugens]|uniref:uncharacterized protein LOC111046938 n=1 Tax=Nilaparvata lugens TaxID=108931 RepID=UPI00193CE970|nr:uncharacterized protein LOC111046938 [Nilaparvata lugens]
MLNHIDFTNLYLLEFFVQKACFDDVDSFLGEHFGEKIKLCFSFQFLQYLPMEVCQEVFLVQNNSTLVLNKGKSCIFASRNLNNKRNPSKFKVKILVSQTYLKEDGCVESKIIGESMVDVGSNFMKGEGIRGEFPLISDSGVRFGYISALLSLTSWGEKIVTRFQSGGQNGDFLFKGMEMDQMARETESSTVHVENQNSSTNITENYSDTVEHKLEIDGAETVKLENESEENSVESFGDDESIVDSEELIEDGDQASELEAKNYKEIEVSINNHLLRIKVMRDKNGRIVYDNGDGLSEDEKRHSTTSITLDESTAKKQIEQEEPVQEPGVVKIKGDRILLDVPEQATTPGPVESPVYTFKSGKQTDANVVTFSQTGDAQMEFGKADRQEETFLMVIKNNRHDSKVKNSNRLDLELRTRRQPEPKPQAEEKNTQYDVGDVPQSGGGKSRKGKKKDGKTKNKKK